MTDREISMSLQSQRRSSVRLFYSTMPGGRRPLTEHCHPELEIHIIENGGGTYCFAGREHTISPRDIFFFRSNELHYCTERTADVSGSPATSYGLYFFPEFIQHLDKDMFDTRYMNIFSAQNLGFINHLSADSYAARQIYSLSREIISEFEIQKQGYEMMIILLLITIIATYVRAYNPQTVSRLQSQPRLSGVNLSSIQRAMNYIDEHLTNRLTLDELAASANMSPSYFSQMFKAQNGFSPWDYVISCRIAMAQQLLQSTDLTVLDIATKCGFNNSANFNRQFRKIAAVSPSEYRKR